VKAQLKRADRLGAALAVICGSEEWERGVAAVRDMGRGTQEDVPLDALVEGLADRMRATV
jgi:histidyl-tRNA synthetase